MEINGIEVQEGLVTDAFEVTLTGVNAFQREKHLCSPVVLGNITYDSNTASFTLGGLSVSESDLSRILMRDLKSLALTYLLKKEQANKDVSEVIS